MEYHPHPDPPSAPAASTRPATPDRMHWTPAKQRAFLTELMNTGNVAGAARAVGMSRSSAHRLRQRLAGTVFAASWRAALRLHAEAVADPFNAPSQTASQTGSQTSSQTRASGDPDAQEARW